MESSPMWGFGGSRSVRSTESGGSSIREIEEEEAVAGRRGEEEEEEEGKVYVAVGKELKEGKATLQWVLQRFSREKRVVITHVHRPAQMIPMMGGKFPASQLKEQQVRAYRQAEREKMMKSLDGYTIACSHLKVRAEKLVIEADDVGKGLVEAITQYGITKLVMGAAADKHYSKKMKVPKSKTAITVKQQADPTCKIWFVCKGILICTREAFLDASGPSPTSNSSSILSPSEQLSSRSSHQGLAESLSWHTNSMQDLFRHRSKSDSHRGGIVAAVPFAVPLGTSVTRSRFSTEGSPTDPWQAISLRSSQSSDHSLWSATDEVPSNSSSTSTPKDVESEEGSVILHSVQESDEDLHFSSPHNEMEDMGVDNEVYDRLQEALTESAKFRREAYNESVRRQKAERDLIEAIRKARALENLHAKEINQRKEVEEALAKEKQEVEVLKNKRDEIFEQLQNANEQKLALELRIAESDSIVKDIEEKLSAAQHLLNTLRLEHEELQLERDAAVEEAEELRRRKEQVTTSSHGSKNFSEFSYSEIEQATCSFSNAVMIGEGGYGSVYKGFLRNTPVAIKMLNPQSLQGQSEFHQEVDVLCRVRHPNLVTLIGACPEAFALIYEYLPNGSLEDRLDCKNNTSPLPWQVRTHIAADMCSALIFLHSNKPHSVVHGDLKPANILLDANLTSKLGDFGICRLLVQSNTTTTFYHHTDPKGTFAYMDPEFLATGELTPQSDVYSFGIIILQLLTGRPALGIVKQVQEALDTGFLHGMIDPTAGGWPFVQAKQLAHLGLRCCEINRKNRPDLVGEAWRVLEPMLKAASLSMSSFSFRSITDDNSPIPNHFICPIFQEIMRDPHIAADGFTYEAEALRGWLDSGHNTSPMTNLRLPNCDLIPNRALRCAIEEWLQQQPQQL